MFGRNGFIDDFGQFFFFTGKTTRHCIINVLAFMFIFLLWVNSSWAVVVYVDKDRAGNGTSWTQAYSTLEAAVNATNSAADFWIAEGTYTPSATLVLGTNQNHSYYGGFAGTETALSQRNISAHPTIIDGQGILKHVFNATSLVTNVRFDGLTITRGNANGAAPDNSGGGIVVNQGTVVITNCTFTNNNATHLGGAVYLVKNPSVTITNSTFTNNTVVSGGGGGVALTRTTSGSVPPAATVSKCTFTGNYGGAVGGGLYSLHYPVTVSQSKFIGNSADNGGGIMLDYKLTSSDRIERSLFANNTSTVRGGALCTFARSVEIENSVFSKNSSTSRGGAVGLHAGQGILAYYDPSYTSIFRNCVFYSNVATSTGGGIDNLTGHRTYIYNSIFWLNQAPNTYLQVGLQRASDDIANEDTSTSAGQGTMDLRYSDMQTWGQADSPVAVNAAGNFSSDPLFVDPDGADNVLGTGDDDLSITYASPCIDRADGDFDVTTDYEFRVRADYPAVPNLGTGTPNYGDIGAFEGPASGSSTPPPPPPPVVPDGVNMSPVLHLLLSGTIFFEDFEGTFPPQGWSVIDWSLSGEIWRRNDFYVRDNLCLYGSGHSAVADSYFYPAGTGMITSLVSPPVNLYVSQAYLGYASHFQDFSGRGQIWLDISTNNGASWSNLRYQTVDDVPSGGVTLIGGTWEVEDLAAYLGNTVLFRWTYVDDAPPPFGWYWQIDNIIVSKEPPPTP